MTFCYPSSDGFQIHCATRVITKNNAATPAEKMAVRPHMASSPDHYQVVTERLMPLRKWPEDLFGKWPEGRWEAASAFSFDNAGPQFGPREGLFAAWDDAVTSRSLRPDRRSPVSSDHPCWRSWTWRRGIADPTVRGGGGAVVSPIGPDAQVVVVVVVTELGVVVEGETPVAVVVVVTELGDVVEGETPVVVVVLVDIVVLVTTEELVVGVVVVVVTVVVVEVVAALGSTLNTAVAQVCDPKRQAVIW